jgi:predicted TIM-barrel fold metal-dependent hydrolase
MLIDINSYIGNWPYRGLRGNTLDSMLARMNKFGVDKAVVANINGLTYIDFQQANEELNAAINSNDIFKNRFIPFATINPVLPWWRDSLEVCHKKFSMKGIRLYPLYHQYKMTEESCIELVKAARDRNMPISIPLRMSDLREGSWLDVKEELTYNDIASLVSKVPDAQYIVLDARLTDTQERTTEQSIKILQNADILFDTSRGAGVPCKGPNGESLQYLLSTFGPKKLAFGTETPFIDYCSPFIRVAVFKEADQATKDLIWSGNARRMLRI